MRLSTFGNLIAAAALAICLAGLVRTDAAAQSKSKLGTAEVAVEKSGGSFIVLYQGREFARFAAPSGRQQTKYCCTATECSPIGSSSTEVCDIVVNCTGQGCVPE